MKITNSPPSKFTQFMRKYYAFKPMRVFITFSTFFCEVSLILYLMVLPIQLAYHSMLKGDENLDIQNNVDFFVCAFFTYHIFLYLDSNIEKIIKSPNSLPTYRISQLGKWTRLVTIQLAYDILTWGISVFMASPQQNTFQQRILELLFFLKIYKIYKFHKKTIYTIIGTNFYSIYKIFFTIMVTFTVISYLSSIFYAIDYAIYWNGGPLAGDIWLVGLSTEPNLIDRPLWVQLLMINYWAMGTSSTAAYGDICGVAPQQIIYNIFILYFANFLYGYYLNNIQIIPREIKQRERKILQQFSHFQKYNQLGKDNRKKDYIEEFDDQLYLKILCSIQYNQTQKSIRKVIEQSVPDKYMQQIKMEIYSEFFASEQLKLHRSKGFFHKEEILLKISKIINESVFEKNENIYDYDHINETNLFYIHQGSIQLRLPGELQQVITIVKNTGEMFGEYCFITNQRRKVNAIALEYVSAYIITREDYKRCLGFEEFQCFDSMFGKCLDLTDERIQNDPYKMYNDLIERKQSIMNLNKPSTRCGKITKVIAQNKSTRAQFSRESLQRKKIYLSSNKNKKKSVSTQTEQVVDPWKKQFENFVSL